MTTAHHADDVRIFERECRSLASSRNYDVYLAAAGRIPDDAGVTLIPLDPPPGSRMGRFTSGPKRAWALSRAVSAALWHFHDPELLPVAIRLAQSGRHVIWDAHEDYVAQFDEQGGKAWVPGRLRGVVRGGTAWLLRGIDRHADGVIAATPAIAARYSNSRTVVVGNEARLELFAACRPDFDSRTVLFTGAASPGQLFEEVTRAVLQVPGVRLAVAGRDLERSTWERARGILGDRLTYLGWLDRPGLCKAIRGASLGLSTYANIPTNADNAPNKLFEFGAAGLPVVATPTPSNSRFLRANKAGVLASGFASEHLAAAITEALSDRNAWDAASSSGRLWALENGSWAGSEARLLRLYADILGDISPALNDSPAP